MRQSFKRSQSPDTNSFWPTLTCDTAQCDTVQHVLARTAPAPPGSKHYILKDAFLRGSLCLWPLLSFGYVAVMMGSGVGTWRPWTCPPRLNSQFLIKTKRKIILLLWATFVYAGLKLCIFPSLSLRVRVTGTSYSTLLENKAGNT